MAPSAQPLRKKYRKPELGLTGKQAFINAVSDNESDIEEALQSDHVYTQYQPIRRRFKRYSFFVSDMNFLWSADLMDMRNVSSDNNDILYCLVCVDTFSRFMRVQPVKRKSSSDMLTAFKRMVANGEKPNALFTDKGTEFTNSAVQAYFKLQNIDHYTSKDADVKASHAERAIRTLRERLVRLYATLGKNRWISHIDIIVKHYNATPTRTHGLAPDAVDHTNCLQVYKKLYPNGYSLPKKPPRFRVGDTVRVSYNRSLLSKKTGKNYTDELFKVTRVIPRHEVFMYELTSIDDDNILDGNFYAEELVKATSAPDSVYVVDRILGSKIDRATKKRLFLVKWQGFSKAHNSWVTEDEIGPVGDM